MSYDLIVIGSGPGGYVAAIRASQLGMKVGVVEKESLGGVCLNWGCIPTKALLKSAEVYDHIKKASEFGIELDKAKPNFGNIIKRSRDVADSMSKGVQFLFKKNKIDKIEGFGKLTGKGKVEVSNNGEKKTYEAKNIIIATGARSKELPNIKQDGKKIIGYREALSLDKMPETMLVIGGGYIGSEFAYFYNSMGTEVTQVEYMPQLMPASDKDVAKELQRSFKKQGIKVMTDTGVEAVDASGKKCKVKVKSAKDGKEETIEVDVVLSAVGVTPNLENIGLEELGIEKEKDKIKVDDFYKTNVDGIYAIGDVVHGPALAHVASHEGIICVEKIAGEDILPLDYNNLPSCGYMQPEVASVGYTEEQAKEAGYELKVGKFPFTASGKAKAAGHKEGFVKVIFDAKYGEWLGAHMIGYNVTELIAEVVVARKLETTGHEIIKAVHPHPTMSEAVMEATADAFGEVIHL